MMDLLERCDTYIREWLPGKLTSQDHELLLRVGVPVSIRLSEGGDSREWSLLETEDGLTVLDEGCDPACRFRLDGETFLRLVSAETSPQRAFFTGKLRIEGNKLLALKLGSLLESIFRRNPYRPRADARDRASQPPRQETAEPLTSHQREMIRLHFDPKRGARYWIERAEATGIRAEDLRDWADVTALGAMDRAEMASRSYRDFVPRAVLENSRPLILGETGGTTGAPVTCAWSRGDFHRAFVDPLPRELRKRGLPTPSQWLFAGPTGPHIIGKAADAVARETTGIDALKVDFDPRWHRRLEPGSTASRRHLEHLCRQTMLLLEREYVDALFITPSLLKRLLFPGHSRWIDRLRLVHLGGQSIGPDEVAWLQEHLPASCALINGYGNSLFGCLVECDAKRPLYYESQSDRLVIQAVSEVAGHQTVASDGETGRVVFHRFDESMLILNAVERDCAERMGNGLYHPRPTEEFRGAVSGGIY